MPEPLVVHLNRDSLYDVEPAVASYESDRPFEVEFRNHGQAVHVHLRLDDALSQVAALEATNYFVDGGTRKQVRVGLREGPRPVRGMLKVVTGYGSGTDYVEVHVSELEDADSVAVDEALGRPPAEAEPLVDVPVNVGALGVGAVVAVALVLTGLVALFAEGLAVLFGTLAVLVGVVVAAYLLALS